MSYKENLNFPSIDVQLRQLQTEIFLICPHFARLFDLASDYKEFRESLRKWRDELLEKNHRVREYLHTESCGSFEKLQWQDYALVRLHDYLAYEGIEIREENRTPHLKNGVFRLFWLFAKEGEQLINKDFLIDLLEMFKQLKSAQTFERPSQVKIKEWMQRHPDGLQKEIINLREANKKRIINILIREIENSGSRRYAFAENMGFEAKYKQVEQWWKDYRFHLRFAVREPELLNEMLDYSLDDRQMGLFRKARQKGIPFFINPYYLSLILVNPPAHLRYADKTLRDYIFYSEDLVREFGNIKAWEKEDKVEEGRPNAAGWLLPNDHNIHRRYPEVAIFIPDSMGRACGGLCVSCQRMYDFQRGNLNFNLEKLKPNQSWPQRLGKLMQYFEFDSHLKDILITGGDSLMSSTRSLRQILDAVLEMAKRKKEANLARKQGEKYAEIRRIRLGTRLPVYLPQRIDKELIDMLVDVRQRGLELGIRDFVIQVHFESPMEISPEAALALQKLNTSGWLVVNQQVFTAAASRRGYAVRLRQMLNRFGVIPYYTFTVKGFRENRYNFAPNARSVQEMNEEKVFGKASLPQLREYLMDSEDHTRAVEQLMEEEDLPFLATDRNVFNMPAVGKSMSFRVVGLTAKGARILMFRHDHTRPHSPAVKLKERVFLVESKSIAAYLRQLEKMGENMDDYKGIYGYSMALTEKRSPIFEYPDEEIEISKKLTNFYLEESAVSS